jgi:hypothetical protein
LINDGSGHFTLGGALTTEQTPSNICSGDLNHDGNPELIITNNDSHNISVYSNLGNGSFGNRVNYPTAAYPLNAAIADFDLDGESDVVVTCQASGEVMFLKGNGDRTLQSAVRYGAGPGASGLAVADFDNDGDPDLAVGAGYKDKIMIIENVAEPQDIGDDEIGIVPEKYQLLSNYPNPFNARTTISYTLAKESDVRIDIYNILGEKVAALDGGHQAVGKHSLIWDADRLSSGLYFARLSGESRSQSVRMILLK